MYIFIINAAKDIQYGLIKQLTQSLWFSNEGPKFMRFLTLENLWDSFFATN